ncbi:MAG: hypothetical protein AAB515_00610 [Patescibacteria group bacterium]
MDTKLIQRVTFEADTCVIVARHKGGTRKQVTLNLCKTGLQKMLGPRVPLGSPECIVGGEVRFDSDNHIVAQHWIAK